MENQRHGAEGDENAAEDRADLGDAPRIIGEETGEALSLRGATRAKTPVAMVRISIIY